MIHTDNESVGAIETPLHDLTIHSARTRVRGVKALNVESRPWIDEFPVCPALNQYQIIHAGIMETVAPTRIVRTKQSTTYFLATFAGRGKVLVDGTWRPCVPGTASLLPAHTLNAFAAVRGSTWKFCWVCYQQPHEQRPLAGASSPVLAKYDPVPLNAAITGLLHECKNGAQPGIIQSWVDLIHNYTLRFAQPLEQDDRLRLLWERVAASLGEKWSLTRLTRESGYSREHLRRLCRSQLGRGPMHQVTHLRIRYAADLLRKTELTMESIAEEVGYQNAFVFSNAFKKSIGWRPSEYRQRKSLNVANPALDQRGGKNQ
ncbi:MAG TPA: helix-turn-helix transcriptional regulator [Verrucomicrobiae bacterium]